MARRGQHGLSDSQKRDLWARWKQGQPMSEIARALEKNHGSIHYAVSLHGGIPPAERRRSRLALSLPEREEVSRGIAAGHPLRQIASMIQRAPSTISREIARNGGAVAIGRVRPIGEPGIRRVVPSVAGWPFTPVCGGWWRRSFAWSGHLSKYPVG